MRSLVLLASLVVGWPTPASGQHPDHPAPQQDAAPEVQHPHEHAPPTPEHEAGLPPGIPPVTDADRAAAFPDVEGHTVHDSGVHYFVLFDELEWRTRDGANGPGWDSTGWVGGDRNRVWFRSEGEGEDGRLGAAEVHVLYGRAIARWWDLVAGIRQDFRPGPVQTWAAVGVQGLARYWFDVEATAYLGAEGRTHLRLETEYELLMTNRMILQPLLELQIYGKADPERGKGSGLSSTDVGLRLRYELRRELAPYVGVLWHTTHFGTADLARAAGEPTATTQLVLGLRVWF